MAETSGRMPFAGHGGEDVQLEALGLRPRPQLRQRPRDLVEVCLGHRHHPPPVAELGRMGLQFGQEGAVLMDGVGRLQAGRVEQHDENPGSLDVAQELVAEALSLGGPFDEPGDVGQHEVTAFDLDHSQVGLQGGERIVGDLGLGGRHGRDQRALAGVGKPDEGGVGNELDFETDGDLVAILALFGEGGGPQTGRYEAVVAAAAASARRHLDLLIGLDEIGEQGAVFQVHNGSQRNRHDQIVAPFAVAVVTLAVGSRHRPVGGDGV